MNVSAIRGKVFQGSAVGLFLLGISVTPALSVPGPDASAGPAIAATTAATRAEATKPPDAVLRIHMISGSKEYGSAKSLPAFKDYLEKNFHVQVTLSMAEDSCKSLPNLDAMDRADVLLIYCRRVHLPDEQLEKIKTWFKAGKPVIGVRTASVAFANWLEMDREIFGGSYNRHGGPETVQVKIEAANKEHPILNGVSQWSCLCKIYRNPANAKDTVPLLSITGEKSGMTAPAAWARVYDKEKDGRAFYTSLGYVEHFENENFRKLLLGALGWVLKRPPQPRRLIKD